MSGLQEAQMGYGGSFNLHYEGNIAILTIECGENRFNDYFVDNFNAALDRVLENPDTQALITTGRGKFYSNGLDLPWMKQLAQENPDRLRDFLTQKVRNLWLRLLKFPIVTVAAMNGHTYAAGAILALVHDYRLMTTTKGWWCLNEVHIGLRFNNMTLGIIKSKLPSGPVLHEAAVLGRRYTAQEALDAGIVTRTCPGSGDQMVRAGVAMLAELLPKQGYKREWLGNAKEDAYGWVDQSVEERMPTVMSML